MSSKSHGSLVELMFYPLSTMKQGHHLRSAPLPPSTRHLWKPTSHSPADSHA
ncbi:hypothetical protein GH733_001328 [Mirounga leonina]|nr:hypothetical protein GH733_001292 [Mirounga leonina]KAF3828093.1 hypothetical protein GH733_001328 [Mirounga leonina]